MDSVLAALAGEASQGGAASATGPGNTGSRSSRRRAKEEVTELFVSDVAGLVSALQTANETAGTATVRVWLSPGVYDLSAAGPLVVNASLDLRGGGSSGSEGGAENGRGAGGGPAVLDCGLRDSEALVLMVDAPEGVDEVRTFYLDNLVFRRCGGRAPLLVDVLNYNADGNRHSADVALSYCGFEDNIGRLAGGVAVSSYMPTDAANSVRLVRCSFSGNSGVTDAGEELASLSDYSAATLAAKNPVPASVVALGRGAHVVAYCNFTRNGVAAPSWRLAEASLQAASSAAVDLSCDGGAAGLQVMFSSFTQGNTGRHAGCIRLNGDTRVRFGTFYTNQYLPSVDCTATVYASRLEGCAGEQAGAVAATCTFAGSSCGLQFNDAAVVGGTGGRSGGVVVRGSGAWLYGDNLTLSGNTGGGLYSADAKVVLDYSLVSNNSGDSYGGLSVWRAPVSAFRSSFTGNTARHAARMTSGAITVMQSTGNDFTRCVFEDNDGTALYVGSADVVLAGSRFARNRAWPGRLGGAVYLTAAYSVGGAANASSSSIHAGAWGLAP